MSAALTLAKPEHLDRLIALVTAFHAEEGIEMKDEARGAGVAPLLDGIPHGAAYLIGPPRAPIGYIVITFGWSVEFGGLDAIIDELYIRPGVRGRGIASEALIALPRALAGGGLRA
ncbi:MAG: GNAT family N-acetyltransferase, partial [Sulfitobacter sp.]